LSHWQTGVDVGGTNTDFLFLNRQTGEYKVEKIVDDVRPVSGRDPGN